MIERRLDGLPAALAMPPQPSIMPATDDDRGEVEALLRACDLPLEGPRRHVSAVASRSRAWNGVLVGCAGIEQWGKHGLLRSVAVAEPYRRKHLAAALVADRLAWARSRMDAELFASVSLLTHVDEVFSRSGFTAIDRAALPAELARSTQLLLAQCSTARAMTYVFFETSEQLIDRAIAAELAEHGTLVPPWIKHPEIPRHSIGWRMGAGEWYLDLWRAWWGRLDDAARAAYRERWKPDVPPTWADWLR